MMNCPVCKTSNSVHRSHSRGFWEQRIFPLIRLKPLRCSRCRHRFLRFLVDEISSDPGPAGRREKEFPVFLDSRDPADFERLKVRLRKRERLLELESQEGRITDDVKKWNVIGG